MFCTLLVLIRFAQLGIAQPPATHKTENVIVVMIDGMRWQEVFRGADPVLIKTSGPDSLDAPAGRTAYAQQHFWRPMPSGGGTP